MLRQFHSVVGPLWSLPWEVQMYLFLPLFFVLLRRFVSLWVVFVLWTASTLLAVAATQPGLPRMYHGAVFPPMFIAGMVAFKLLLRAPPPREQFTACRSMACTRPWPFYLEKLASRWALV